MPMGVDGVGKRRRRILTLWTRTIRDFIKRDSGRYHVFSISFSGPAASRRDKANIMASKRNDAEKAKGKAAAQWENVKTEVIERTDIEWAYRELGITLVGRPNSKGWVSVEGNTSLRVNVGDGPARGRIRDFGGDGVRGSLFDYAVAQGKFSNSADGFKEALKYYAKAAGVELPSRLSIKRAVDHIKFQDWNDVLADAYCKKKPPITPEGIRAAGGRMAMYPANSPNPNSVIAIPVYGPHLLDGDPVAWTGPSRGKPKVEIWSGGRSDNREAKFFNKKDHDNSIPVWVGTHGVEALAEAEFVWKVEGVTDLLAALSVMLKELPPEEQRLHAILTNFDGCNATPNEYHIASVAGKKVRVVHDADRPGQGIHAVPENGHPRAEHGARKWCLALATAAKEVRNVQLPFEIAENHGKDLRDFFSEGGTWAELIALAEDAEVVEPPEDEDFLEKQTIADIEERYRSICRDVGIEVIGEWGNGNVEIYSRYHGKTQRIDRFSKVRLEDLKSFCGPPGEMSIAISESPGTHRLSTVRTAVLFLAGYKEMTEDCFTGFGCHRGKDKQGRETNEIVIVNSEEVGTCKDEQFDVFREPNYGGLYFHLSKTPGWCDFSELTEVVAAAREPSWRAETLMLAEREFSRWNWYQSSSPQLISGLVAATFIQGLWRWRPQVAITGRSHAGKSYLFETIEQVFSGLAVNLSGDSTPKGVLQEIGKLNKILIIDEWDKTPHKDQVLSILRNAGRGKSFRATGQPSQTARKTGVKVIGWIAGITSNATEEADWNRFITCELLPARVGEAGKLTIAPESELRELGHRLLAVALVCGLDAVSLAERLKPVQVSGVHARLVESYAVPAAMIACGIGEGEEYAEGLLKAFLNGSAEQVSEARTDEQQFFDEIMGAIIDAGKRLSRRSVQTLIDLELGKKLINVGQDDALDAGPYLRQVGLAIGEQNNEKCLFIHPPTASKHIFKGTRFERVSIPQLLGRITGGPSQPSRIFGGVSKVYSVPLKAIGIESPKENLDF